MDGQMRNVGDDYPNATRDPIQVKLTLTRWLAVQSA
jgi:hypothetical protein